jgi:NAD(P)-dependent dehydrogenase (short-subunit alcohol dehydrogenase family)
MTQRAPWSTAWVTGASSGLGREIALRLAAGGCKVAISARSADKLAELCASAPGLTAFPYDVRDADMAADVANRIVATLGIPDLVVLNAGIGEFKSAEQFDAERFSAAFQTNVIGIGNALAPIIPHMVARGSGQIALMGSLAGYRGFPRAANYAPTKAAIRSLAECLRFDLEEKGIDISLISPGYIQTHLTQDLDIPMPGLMPLQPAVDKIMTGLRKRRYEIAFPWHMVLLVKLSLRAWNEAYFFMARWFVGR